MSPQEFLQLSDEEVLTIARQLRTGYGLKRTLRYASARDHSVHSESVAEHVCALLLLSKYFLRLEDPEWKYSQATVDDIILFHDFPEMEHGDVPYHLKTAELEARERDAAPAVFARLPPILDKLGHAAWEFYERRACWEAEFVYALDKVEPLFELADPINEKSMKRLKFSYELHIGKKLRATEHFPIMRRFVDVMSADMLARGVFWVAEANDDA